MEKSQRKKNRIIFTKQATKDRKVTKLKNVRLNKDQNSESSEQGTYSRLSFNRGNDLDEI